MKFLSRFENPERPLLGPNISVLEILAMWQPPNRKYKNYIFDFLMCCSAIFTVSESIELARLILESNYEAALRNLSFTLLSTMCFLKQLTFIVWQKYWKELFDFATNLEKSQRCQKDEKIDTIMDGYHRYSWIIRCLTYTVVSVTVAAGISSPIIISFASTEIRHGIINGSIPYPELMSIWVPFDKTRGAGYCFVLIVEAYQYIWGGVIISAYDTTAVTLFSFFAGQLKVLKVNCRRIFGDINEQVSCEESVKRIKACHDHHLSVFR